MTCSSHTHIAGDSERVEVELVVEDSTIDLTGSSGLFLLYENGETTAAYSVAGDVELVAGQWVASFDIPKDGTAAIVPGFYQWRVSVEGVAFRRTPIRGTWRVLAKVAEA